MAPRVRMAIDEAVGLRRRLELARLRLPAPLGGVESDEVDGDVIRSWELYGATAGVVVLEEGSCLALAAEGDADGPRRADDGHADRARRLRLAAWRLPQKLSNLGDERRRVLDVRHRLRLPPPSANSMPR